jgi:phosphomannomutase
MAGIFKAYDIRGIYPEPLDEAITQRIGMAIADLLQVDEIVVGRDVRLSSDALFEALTRGICRQGTDVIDIGLSSTPMSYYAVASLGAGGSVQITASHNPKEYNGFKLCRAGAVPISGDTGIADIERLANGPLPLPAAKPGSASNVEVIEGYLSHLMGFAKDVRPMKITVDAANGMAGLVLPRLLERLPQLTVESLYLDLDGTFPNHPADPLHVENLRDLQARVVERGCAVGFAFDGDADRVICVDEQGRVVSADLITALLAPIFLDEQPGATILYDLRSSDVVKEEIEAAGGRPIQCRVGHAFIKQQMREADAIFAGELSGHFYYKDNFFTDCGITTMLRLLAVLSRSDVPLSRRLAGLRRYVASGEINSKVGDPDAVLAKLEDRFQGQGEISHIDGLSVRLAWGWLNVRKSNTEPLLRLNLEARTQAEMERRRDEVLGLIRG